MSEENVEIVRAGIEASNRRDLDALFTDVAPDCEFDLSRAVGPDHGVHKLDQARRVVDEFFELWESARVEVNEFVEAGEHVVTPFTNYLRGRDGIEVQARAVWVWTIRDGVIVRVCLYQDKHEALEAVGLGE